MLQNKLPNIKHFLYYKKNVWISILIILSLMVTFYHYGILPKNLAWDEILFAKLALSLDKKMFVPFTSLADGHATIYFYIILLSFKLFGITNFALRIPSAIFGILGTIVFFLITNIVLRNKTIYKIPLSFITSVIFICLAWRINFVRFSFEMPYLLFLELLAAFFLLSYFDKKNNTLYLFLSGIFSGLAFNSYQPGLLFFMVPLAFLLFKKQELKKVAYFIMSFGVIIMPLVLYFLLNKIGDTRIQQLSFINLPNLNLSTKITYLIENIVKTTLMFVYKGDANGRHNFPFKPALNPILGILFVTGLILSIQKLREKYNLYFVIWFLTSLVPLLLTLPSENPHMLRSYTVIPSIIYFCGYAIMYIHEFFPKKILRSILIVLLCLSCLYELRAYFIFQSRVARNAFEVTCNLDQVIYLHAKSLGAIPTRCRVNKNMF